jgi:predicted MPP superfamily phosphohydrolase
VTVEKWLMKLAGPLLLRTNHASHIELVRIDLSLPRLHIESDGYKLNHISDIHMGGRMTSKKMVNRVDLVNQQNADVIAITGDFVSYHAEGSAENLRSILSRFKTILGFVRKIEYHKLSNKTSAFSCPALYLQVNY